MVVAIIGLAGLALLSLLKVVPNPKKAMTILFTLIGLWLGLGLILPAENLIAASLQTGLLDPIPLFHRSINLTLLPLAERLSASQRYYQGSLLIGAVFLTAVFLNRSGE